METDKLVKLLIGLGVVLLALPFALKLMPKPMTFERVQAGFAKAGLPVESFEMTTPSNESAATAGARIGGAGVTIYQYDDEGKIARYTEYQKTDPGTAIVAQWNLAESLGAAKPKQTPTRHARRGMFLIVAMGDDTELLDRIIAAFKAA